jgi:hypothetical protein
LVFINWEFNVDNIWRTSQNSKLGILTNNPVCWTNALLLHMDNYIKRYAQKQDLQEDILGYNIIYYADYITIFLCNSKKETITPWKEIFLSN